MPRLYKECRFDELVLEAETRSMADSFGVIASRWANDHRFASPDKLRKHLNEIGATYDVKGDKLSRNSVEMYEAAERIVGLGIMKWKN